MRAQPAGLRTLVLISLPFAVLVGCASPSPRADREVVPTGGPRAEPGEMVAMAMDETTDPEPPGGRPDVSAIGDTTVFLQSTGYDVVYSETKRNPLVVAYFLRQHQDNDFECERPPAEAFHTDTRTVSKVAKTHYVNTGFDRGHMAPNSAIATRYGCDAQLETFLMSNMAPQLPGLNQITWGGHERIVDHIYADKFEGIWVLTGPVFHPTEIITLKGREIEVPVEFWKIVIRRDDDGDVDAAGIVMTKEERRNRMPVSTFVTTIDDIESRTGIDFFPDMAVDEEEALESACPGADWELAREVFATFPGIPRPINEEPPRPRPQALGTQFGHEPFCAN